MMEEQRVHSCVMTMGKPLMTMRIVAAEHCETRDSAAGARGAKTIDHSVRTLITVINPKTR